ncbi:hypothetical protein BGX34_003785 [Mortierella sp. NVP85]|nr:hypothetical protein BGX34_003785 [Mortierella sp. NVP85]
MIHRKEDGKVLVIDLSRNGTYINNMKIEFQKACQLFTGDEIAVVMPPADEKLSRNLPADHVKYLKYTVEILGMPPASPDQIVHRRYFQCDKETLAAAGATPLVNRLRERSPQRSEKWAVLRELLPDGEEVREYGLYLKTTRIGRDLNCKLEWESEEGKAYLINMSNQGTYVNGEQCTGRFQLRDKDEIRLLDPLGIWGTEAKKGVSKYRIEFVPMDAPPTKRHRNETLDT